MPSQDFVDTYGWYIGVGLGIGSSIVSNLGVNIQKLAHSHRAKKKIKNATESHFGLASQTNDQSFDNKDNTDNNDTSDNTSPSNKTISVDKHTGAEIIPDHSEDPIIAIMEMQKNKDISPPSSNSNTSQGLSVGPGAGESKQVNRLKQLQQLKELKQPKKLKPYLLDAKWITGLVLQMVGASMDFTALGFAPASVVAPLGSLTLVTNVCLAPVMHHEKLSIKTIIATLCIIIGTITTVIFSPRVTGVDSTDQVFNLFKSTAFAAYAIPTSILMIATFIIFHWMDRIKKLHNNKYTKFKYKVHRFSIATLSGTTGAQNVFFAKCVSSLLIFSIEGNGKMMLLYWQTYIVIIGLLCTIYFQLKWLNIGLKGFSALHIVPVFQSFWITVSVIGGLLVYQEFESMEVVDKIVFPVGVIVTIIGVALLTSQHKPKKLKESASSMSDEQTENDNDDNGNENDDIDDIQMP